MNDLVVPSPTFGVAPGTMCHVLAPASVKGPPSGRMPVGRLASNCVIPFGGAPMMAVLTGSMVGGPWIGPAASAGRDVPVPVTVW